MALPAGIRSLPDQLTGKSNVVPDVSDTVTLPPGIVTSLMVPFSERIIDTVFPRFSNHIEEDGTWNASLS